jgi:Cu-processing system ATP-binding protein
MISINNLSKKFGRMTALQDVSLTLQSGTACALIGPNGSGKTTLIKSILGLVVPSGGEIIFDGKNIRNDWTYRKSIGYMPQIGKYPENMRIGEVVEMMKDIRAGQSGYDEELIDSFQLGKIYHKRMHTLSGGTRQKVSAALAFLFHAPVLILDEPTAGLDPVSSELLKEKILKEKQKGKLVIISSHILSDLDELVTDIIYLFEGRVQYNNTIASLKMETGEGRLGKAMATFIKQKELISTITD